MRMSKLSTSETKNCEQFARLLVNKEGFSYTDEDIRVELETTHRATRVEFVGAIPQTMNLNIDFWTDTD